MSRKKIAISAVGACLVLYVGSSVYQSQVSGPAEARKVRIAKLHEDIRTRQRDLERIQKAVKELDAYREQSLPANPEVARSLYGAWLLQTIEQAGFTNPNVDSGEPANRKGLFQMLTFSIRGRGTLEQVTKLLYDFYSADHLQQIRSLTLMPLPAMDQLDVAMIVEALVLPTATRKDRLSDRRSERLAYDKLDDYKIIVERNVFGVGGSTDPTDFTYLTAVNYVDGQAEVWFTVRTSDSVLRLRKGDPLEIGHFKGVIADVYQSDVVLESEGERWLLTVGENISQAAALPPEF
jgi:hypothetical protein